MIEDPSMYGNCMSITKFQDWSWELIGSIFALMINEIVSN